MIGCDFHPEALADLDEIWDFVSAESVDAADRVIADILIRIHKLPSLQIKAIVEPISALGQRVLPVSTIT